MKTFEVGKRYETRAYGDHNLIYWVEVVKRTEKTVTVTDDCGNVKRCKIHIREDGEWIIPEKYSGAPVFRACREMEG